jgi:hypothetical protein
MNPLTELTLLVDEIRRQETDAASVAKMVAYHQASIRVAWAASADPLAMSALVHWLQGRGTCETGGAVTRALLAYPAFARLASYQEAQRSMHRLNGTDTFAFARIYGVCRATLMQQQVGDLVVVAFTIASAIRSVVPDPFSIKET